MIFFLAITEVGNLNSSADLDCGMTVEIATNRPVLKIFDRNGSTIEEEDISRKDNGKKYLVLKNKRTNEVFTYLLIFYFYDLSQSKLYILI